MKKLISFSFIFLFNYSCIYEEVFEPLCCLPEGIESPNLVSFAFSLTNTLDQQRYFKVIK